ncbi:MAG: DUF4403 family protein [Bacteroidetes bacterium]|nr:DUF4403 family protein [Bacteroidota bacterium]
MKKFINGIVLVLLAGMFVTGCKSLQPQMPAESYKYTPAKPQTSVVSLYADLDVARMEALVNNNMDSLLYDDHSFKDNNNDNLKLKAWKDGQIKFSFHDDLLSWEIPLRVDIKKTALFIAFNHPFGDIMEANGEIKLKFKTRLSVNRDWSIKTVTTPEDYEWIRKPTVKIGGFTIPVTAIANILLRFNLDSYSQNIDKTIENSFDFRKYAEKGWQMLFEPFKIPGDYNAWLSMTPYSISLLPVKGTNGSIRFGFVVNSDAECLLDKQPPVGKASGLPVIKPLDMPCDTFRINLLTDIPYSTIERLTLREIHDSVYTFGKKRLTFESIHIYGTNGKMAIEMKVKGSIKGTMYLTGTPYFNSADTTLQVRDLKFDLKTRNLLVKSARWMFNGKIERTITRAIAIPFNTNVREIESNLTGFMNHYQLGYGFELNGKLAKITVSDIMLTPESVKANLVFSGKLAIGIEEMALKK